MSDEAIRASFIPLVDAAPLIVAKQRGFDRQHGISLSLHKSASWAALRDRLSVGLDQCAHMLAPIPIASQLGVGNPKARMVVPCGLSMNGNAISVSTDIYQAMMDAGFAPGDARNPSKSAHILAKVIQDRKEKGGQRLTLASVYPISPHAYELKYWLAHAGIDPQRDVNLTILPPTQMLPAISDGFIDGYCVGAPWNGLGEESQVAKVVATKADIWRQGPEKVLALREDWASERQETVEKLVRMIIESAAWCSDPANFHDIAQILSDEEFLGIDSRIIKNSLLGKLPGLARDGSDDYLIFDPKRVCEPRPEHALWFYAQMVRWGQVDYSAKMAEQAKNTYITTYFSPSQVEANDQSSEAEENGVMSSRDGHLRLFDGVIFDADDIPGYLAKFADTA